jgi:hypothetical protein
MSNQFRTLPPMGGDARQVAEVVNRTVDGKLNSTGTVTLTASASSTTVSEDRAGPDSVILFMPTTSNAATEMNHLYVSSRGKQTFTLGHRNNAQSDRTFSYVVIG